MTHSCEKLSDFQYNNWSDYLYTLRIYIKMLHTQNKLNKTLRINLIFTQLTLGGI